MASDQTEKKILLSVVVPVYNGEKFIKGCLQSLEAAVLALSKEEQQIVEIIICDNRSSDQTLATACSFQMACPLEVIQPDQHFENRTQNWHYGLYRAHGDWMVMLHVDDLMAPGGLRAILNACRQPIANAAVLISGQHRTFTDDTEPSSLKPKWPVSSLIHGEELRRHVLPLHCPFVPFTVMRRAAYLELGGLDDSYELVQDWNLWIRLLAIGNLFYYAEEFGLWRTHGFSEKYAETFAREHLLLSERMNTLIPRISSQMMQMSFQAQAAKSRQWVSEDTLVALLKENGLSASDASEKVSAQNASKMLQKVSRHVTLWLSWLRIRGSFHLIRQRLFFRNHHQAPAPAA